MLKSSWTACWQVAGGDDHTLAFSSFDHFA
jgi:hypothetical protein